MQKEQLKAIADYFNKNQLLANLLWHKMFHYGFWNRDTRNNFHALNNTNKFIAGCLEIQQEDKILDAGCGSGVTSIYIAEKYNAEIIGITISAVQLKQAKRDAGKFEKQLNFFNMDYSETKFSENYFDKIFALESSCYALNKEIFVKELARIIKPGGILVVADGFLSKIKNEKLMEKFLDGWKIPFFLSLDEFCVLLKNEGFAVSSKICKTKDIQKSVIAAYRLGIIFFLFSWIGKFLRIIPKSTYTHCVSCILQKAIFTNNLLEYYVVIAKKSE